jgi:hypothetical protein
MKLRGFEFVGAGSTPPGVNTNSLQSIRRQVVRFGQTKKVGDEMKRRAHNPIPPRPTTLAKF